MKVLLWQDIVHLGKRGDIVKVSDGYARNFLFPRRMASLETAENLRLLAIEKKRAAKLDEEMKANCRETAKFVEGKAFTIEVLANEEGVLFGSVTPTMIVDMIAKDCAIKIDAKTVHMEEHIKELGVYPVKIVFHPEVQASCRLWVVLADKASE
ncbi:MAG: 50S ribosomal protein L9 [Planctomycetota bacterium]|nr:50S ribosomal protein L9 [Planctomycetota bacterium]